MGTTIRFAVGAALAATIVMPVGAQEAPSGRLIEEVIVTAQKREERLQDVPISIASSVARHSTRSSSTKRPTSRISCPACRLTNGAGPRSFGFFIRGIGTTSFSSESIEGSTALCARRRRDGPGGRVAHGSARHRARRSAARAAGHAVRQERFGRRDQHDDHAPDRRVDCARHGELGEARRRAQGQRPGHRADHATSHASWCPRGSISATATSTTSSTAASSTIATTTACAASSSSRRPSSLTMMFIGDYWKRDAECCIWTLRRTGATPSVIPEQQQPRPASASSADNQTQNINGDVFSGHQELRRVARSSTTTSAAATR